MLLLGVLASQAEGVAPAPPPPAFLTSAPLWLDASDTATITESSGSVSQWDNKGTLENIVQATAADQPTTGVSTLNGLNVIDFAGDFMEGQTLANWKFLHDGTIYFVAAVVKYGVVANPTAFYALLGTNRGATAAIGNVIAYDDRTNLGLGPHSLNTFMTRGASGANVISIVDPNFFSGNTFLIESMIYDPTDPTAANRIDYYVDDTQGTINNTRTDGVSTSNPSHILQIGAPGDGSGALTGAIAELIIVSGADATEVNRQATVDYLNGKWGIY